MSDDGILVGLTGLARSGKTTAAEYLVNRHGFTIVSMADPLKEMAKKLDPMIGVEDLTWNGEVQGTTPVHLSAFLDDDGDFLENYSEDWVKENFPEYRRVLQKLGTDCVRSIDQDFWINAFWDTVRGLWYETDRIVVPDVRFPNEASTVLGSHRRDLGMHRVLAFIDREGIERGAHASEQHAGRMGENAIIENNGTLVELAEQLDEMVRRSE